MKIKVKRIINAPAQELWAYLGDYSNIHRFHPMLNDSHWVDGSQTCEIGSTRQCDFKDGSIFKEQIIDWQEGKQYSIKVVESTGPVKDAVATLGLKPLGEHRTEVFMEIEMTVENRLMSPMLYLGFKYQGIPSIFKGLEQLHREEHTTVNNAQVA